MNVLHFNFFVCFLGVFDWGSSLPAPCFRGLFYWGPIWERADLSSFLDVIESLSTYFYVVNIAVK